MPRSDYDLTCPHCDSKGPFYVVAEAVLEMGEGADNKWHSDIDEAIVDRMSWCSCKKCNFTGSMSDFMEE